VIRKIRQDCGELTRRYWLARTDHGTGGANRLAALATCRSRTAAIPVALHSWSGLVGHDCRVDDHTRRVTAPVRVALEGFERGDVTVADVQAAVVAASGALDNSSAGLAHALGALGEDLEEIRFAMPVEDQPAAVRARSTEVKALLAAER